jgi:hypothetical protein
MCFGKTFLRVTVTTVASPSAPRQILSEHVERTIWLAQTIWAESGRSTFWLFFAEIAVQIDVHSNAAKARIRDTATRTQKRFFGRKRLEILGKHLEIGSGRPKSPEKTQKTLKDILSGMNLAHARRQAPSAAVEPLQTVHRADLNVSFSPKASTGVPSSPRSSSKIIQALDSEQLARKFNQSASP